MRKTMMERYGSTEIFNRIDVKNKSHSKESNTKRSASLHEHLEQFEKENNCIHARKIGRIPFDKINITPIYYKNRTFIKISDVPLVNKYYNTSHRNRRSQQEKYITSQLSNYKIVCNDRKQIYPYEIDIYLPEFNIGIEFNGTWHHSVENNKSKDYHLQKSLRCRAKNIRLIHIYEFENLEEQIDLLLSLLNGVDNYSKEDFNKNNLINKIPKPEIIYSKEYTVYGAGKLWR